MSTGGPASVQARDSYHRRLNLRLSSSRSKGHIRTSLLSSNILLPHQPPPADITTFIFNYVRSPFTYFIFLWDSLAGLRRTARQL